jgi:assimilatory nitrate reductase catalytic subunit
MNAPLQSPHAVRTTCPYCGVGCGLLVTPDGRGGAIVSGDPSHPANAGRLCSKGAALGETLGLDSRLLHPLVRRADHTYARVDWDQALDQVAHGLRGIIDRSGPDSIAFYLSGQLLTEDYYVANKLMKGFIGTANVDTNSRLCMASSVAGHRRAFGSDTVPGCYEDLDQADLIILVGSNAAWCHPILFQRMVKNQRERGARIVVIDPRRTATAEGSDLFLPIAPGMDALLFSGLLVHLADTHALDYHYIATHTVAFENTLARAREITCNITRTARLTGLPEADIQRFYELFQTISCAVTCFSQGVNQSAQGTDKVNAIINCHLATGRVGKPGAGPFSLTGQPNAMGGREVGGLANQLAAHMGFAPVDIDRVRRFWRAPRIATHEGLKAVQMFDAIAAGTIKALWVMGSNPAASLPRAGAMSEALKKLELLVVSDNVLSNDTIKTGAHVLLPAAAWGEKGGTVTNSERRMSRQRPFLPLPGEARPDWWIVSQVARRMGFADSFAYRSPADVFREHAALSAFENHGERDFDLGTLVSISDEQFDALQPTQWPTRAGQREENRRVFGEGGFFTSDRKACFIAPQRPALQAKTSKTFPFRLNTGRIRDQWHTMTRSGLSPRLGQHLPLPFVEVHPSDAEVSGLRDGGFARVASRFGTCLLTVSVNAGQRRGSLFAPIHWTAETSSSGRIGEVVAANVDPISGQPETKATPATITPVKFDFRGFILTRSPVEMPEEAWWVKVAVNGGVGYFFAGDQSLAEWRDYARGLFATDFETADYVDEPRGIYRIAAFRHSRLDGCLFVGPVETAPHWNGIAGLFAAPTLSSSDRRILLSGRTADGLEQGGPLVCSCFGVGLIAIQDFLASGQASDAEGIGKALGAGTNCGSCLPEIKRIIADACTRADV